MAQPRCRCATINHNGRRAMSVRESTLTLVVAAASAAAMLGLGQMPAASAADKPSFKVPRTSWGDPDLQGVWDYRTITPFERRAELGDREYYTDEEIAQLEGRAARGAHTRARQHVHNAAS